jgi:hypothetical protein
VKLRFSIRSDRSQPFPLDNKDSDISKFKILKDFTSSGNGGPQHIQESMVNSTEAGIPPVPPK